MTDAVSLAREVLAADGEPFKTLSLAPGLPAVSQDTPVPEARRNYMRIAGVIHPDKLKATFDKATEAFQALVRAFEVFADPKARKAAAAAAAVTQSAKAKKATSAASHTAAKTRPPKGRDRTKPLEKPSGKSKKEPQARPKRKTKKGSDSDDEELSESEEEKDLSASESEGTEDEEEDDDEEAVFASPEAEPEVSTNRTPIGQPRTGGLYAQTTVGCPACRTSWEPDAKPQYTLFMGPWGMRVHCQLCLFRFGSATALHACPHCSASFDYDASMYDDTLKCQRCKKEFGFPYYPINQHLIDMVKLEDWKEQREREHAREREARLRARRGGAEPDEAADKLAMLVGTCIMDDRCPLCNARVKSKHRAHVEECMKHPSDGASATKRVKTAAASAPPATVTAAKAAAVARPPPVKSAAVDASPSTAKPRAPARKSAKAGGATTRTAAGSGSAASRKRRRAASSSEDEVDDDTSEEEEASGSDSDSEESFSESSDEDDSDE